MRRAVVWSLLGLVVLVTALVALSPQSGAARASSLSRGAHGLLAARRYLEERGCVVSLLDRSLEPAPDRAAPGALVLAFPWQRFGFDEPLGGLHHHLLQAGVIVVLYSGERPGGGEAAVLDALGLRTHEVRGNPPLHPLRWRAFMTEEWTLAPVTGGQPLRVAAPREIPQAPKEASVLYRSGRGDPLVFEQRRGAGRLVVAPADAFTNARLDQEGNADFLEALRERLGDTWTFDELHHGLAAPVTAGEVTSRQIVDLTLVHLLFLYGLALLALGRRFGPAWSEPPVTSGSAASLLVGLGGLHHRLGHHSEAARLLVARARELDPRLRLPDTIDQEAGAGALLRVAAVVGRAQQRSGRRT